MTRHLLFALLFAASAQAAVAAESDLYWLNSSNIWVPVSNSNPMPTTGSGGGGAFNAITSGTNTTATMTVGAGASLTFTSTGVVNANQLGGVALLGGTLTNTDVCTYASSGTLLNCNTALGTAAGQIVTGGVITAGGPTGSATVAPIITYNAAGQLTTVSSATITPAVGSITGLGTGVATALGNNVGSAGAPVTFNGAGGTPSSLTLTNATGLPNASVAASPLATGSSTGNTVTAPRGYFVCTAACTVTPPVPAAGYEFCVLNDDNVSGAITLGAIGSSARYENTARTAYGTAGTGTLVSTGAVGDKVCLVGRDATHYLTVSFSGSWTAN